MPIFHNVIDDLKPKLHHLKTWVRFYQRIERGEKLFEIRKNDRGFCEGDFLVLHEYNEVKGETTGRQMLVQVTYLTIYEQKDDFVVMGIKPVTYSDLIQWVHEVDGELALIKDGSQWGFNSCIYVIPTHDDQIHNDVQVEITNWYDSFEEAVRAAFIEHYEDERSAG